MNRVLVTHQENIRYLRLNRPECRNALNPALIMEFGVAFEQAVRDAATSVVVICGQGASFCAGADLAYLHNLATGGGDPIGFLTELGRCFSMVERSPKPVVAAVQGHAVAGGLELALACDVVVARAGTLIGDGHVRHELVPGGGSSVRLARKVGEPLARWLLLSGQLLPAERFLSSGFVHRVAPAATFHSAVLEVARSLGEAGGVSQSRAKRMLSDHLRASGTDAALERELRIFEENWRDADLTRVLARFGDAARERGKRCTDTPVESSS